MKTRNKIVLKILCLIITSLYIIIIVVGIYDDNIHLNISTTAFTNFRGQFEITFGDILTCTLASKTGHAIKSTAGIA